LKWKEKQKHAIAAKDIRSFLVMDFARIATIWSCGG